MGDIVQIPPPKPRDGRQPGPADLHIDVLNRGNCLPRGLFEGDGPARRLGRESQREARRAAQARDRERKRRANLKAAKGAATA
jgi:hypothetical protein